MSKTRIIEAVQKLDLATARQLIAAKPSLLTVHNRQGRNLLHLACGASCAKLRLPETAAVRMVNYLLDLGMDIEEPGLSGRDPVTPLWFAVCFGRNVTLVKRLLQRGAKPQLAPGHGLYAAGWWEDTHILDVLIKAGAEVDLVSGVTPFFACWLWRKFESAKFLARKGANVDFQDPRNGKTALHYGVEKEFDPAMLKWLVKHGASVNIKDNEGVTPLLKASRKRDKRFFRALNST